MAGKNQHHVWQHLQRGFGTKRGKDHHIWVYERDSDPHQTVTRKWGSDDYFYGPADSPADKNITDFEGEYQDLIHEARRARNGTVLPSDRMGMLVAHLEMRSEFLRAETSALAGTFLEALGDYLKTANNNKKLVQRRLASDPDMIRDMAVEQGASNNDLRTLDAFLEVFDDNIVESLSAQMAGPAQLILEQIIPRLAELAKNAHNRVLEERFGSTGRSQYHERLEYQVIQVEDGQIILPDTALAFVSGKKVSPFTSNKDNTEMVILPVSSESFIVGAKAQSAFRPVQTVRNILASCAYRSFIAKTDIAANRKLAKRIGKNAKLLRASEIREVLEIDALLGAI